MCIGHVTGFLAIIKWHQGVVYYWKLNTSCHTFIMRVQFPFCDRIIHFTVIERYLLNNYYEYPGRKLQKFNARDIIYPTHKKYSSAPFSLVVVLVLKVANLTLFLYKLLWREAKATKIKIAIIYLITLKV